MKAGAALGLLAGLGAINALRGGREGTGKRFTGLMDMLDGGGAGASGDRFEGGGLLSALGNLFAKPLEAQDNVERIAADTNATKAVTKTLEDMAKGGTPTSRLDGKDGLLAAPVGKTMDEAVGGAQYPSMYRSMDSRVGLLQQAQSAPQPNPLTGGTVQPMPASSQMDRYLPASMNMGESPAMPVPSMPSPETFSANAPSVAAMTPPAPAPEDRNSRLAAFNEAMATVPQMLQGTEIADMYRDHLLNGGGGTFAQFTGAQ